MEKMEIYNAVRAVPKEAQKPFNNGRFKGTDINPMWRIKTLTEAFGACGSGWYVDDVEERWERLDDDTIIAIVNLKLYVKIDGEWSKPIYGTGGNVLLSKGKPSDEGYKMAYTDALSVACKALGIGADIYFSGDKSSKYAQYYTQDSADAEPEPTVPEVVLCDRCGNAIQGVKVGDKTYTAAELIGQSKIKYSGKYCWSCMKVLKAKSNGTD